MTTMKENKGKCLVNEEVIQEEENVQTQSRPVASEKRKTLSSTIDLGSLPSPRGYKKLKHGSSKSVVVEASPHIPSTAKQSSIAQILDVDLPRHFEVTTSKPPTSPPDIDPQNPLKV